MGARPVLCVLAALGVLARPAAAEPAPARSSPSSTADTASLADLVRRADEARLAGRWERAAATYTEALAAADRSGLPTERRAPILAELGACEAALGKHRDAAEHLYEAMKHEEALPREHRARYRQAQRRAEQEVATVIVGVSPPDATVFIDDNPIGARKSSHVIFLHPGVYTLRARLPGYGEQFQTIEAQKGTMPMASLHLRELPATRTILVQGRRDPSPAPSTPVDKAATLRTTGYLTAGAGVLLGVGFTIAGAVVDDTLEARSADLGRRSGTFTTCNGPGYETDCDALLRMEHTRDLLDGAAVAAFIGSAAIGGLALSSMWWAPSAQRPSSSTSSIRILPAVSGTQGGAVLVGRW